VVAKVVAASQKEAHDLVASVAAKYGLVGDYGRAEETIKAVWGQRVSEPGCRQLAAGSGQGQGARCRCSAFLGLLIAGKGHCVASTAAASSHPPSCRADLQPNASRANSAAAGLPAAAKHPASQQQQQQMGGAEELTLGKGSSDNASGDEETGQQATSTLKPLAPVSPGTADACTAAYHPANASSSLPSAAPFTPFQTCLPALQTSRTDGEAGIGSKRPLVSQPSFSFRAASQSGAAADDAALKKRRVHYDRMRELEAEVQRVRHLGDALKQSLHQAEAQVGGEGGRQCWRASTAPCHGLQAAAAAAAINPPYSALYHTHSVSHPPPPACLPISHLQHYAATMENEQLWNALLHIHASLRAAHAAHLRQQVAMHAAAVAAAVLPPASVQVPSPNLLFGGLFSPGG
jgi:hypothetical protein